MSDAPKAIGSRKWKDGEARFDGQNLRFIGAVDIGRDVWVACAEMILDYFDVPRVCCERVEVPVPVPVFAEAKPCDACAGRNEYYERYHDTMNETAHQRDDVDTIKRTLMVGK
jgi:hypothetical protein